MTRRKEPDNYRLHVESITYLGDDEAAARAILNFLRRSVIWQDLRIELLRKVIEEGERRSDDGV